MKTKKILAIVTLVAFMISILPMAAFAVTTYPLNTYGSVISVTTASAKAISTPSDSTKDGVEFELVAVAEAAPISDTVYVQTNRGTTDKIYYDNGTTWVSAAAGIPVSDATKVKTIDIKILSNIAGNVKVAFGTDASSVLAYANGQEFGTDDGISYIIGQQLYSATFTAASVSDVTLTATTGEKAANGVSYHEVTAFVEAAGYPVSGAKVTFSITGSGATLSASEATTKTNGKATIKVTATKPGTYEVTAKSSSTESDPVSIKFGSTGIVDIKAASDNNQKVAIVTGGEKTFKYNLYDANGNKISLDAVAEVEGLEVEVITKPSGATLSLNVEDDFSVNADGQLVLTIDLDELNKEGKYEIRANLLNGKAVTYTFTAKEQDDVVSMAIEYDATSYAAESYVAAPTVKYADAEGYETEGEADPLNVVFSVSDANYILDWDDDGLGGFDLEDKMGSFVVTAIDEDKELVATYTISVEKAASALKLTAPAYTAIGEDATVKIQLVDGDGKAVASGYKATSSKALVLSKPSGAIVSGLTVDTDDFAEGTASVDVSSNIAGDVKIQVVITESTGKVYTGSATVTFGVAAAARQGLTMFIGSQNYMVGSTVMISDTTPFIQNGRTFVAVRPIGEALGAAIGWNEATQTVTLSKPGEVITIVIGASVIKVDKAGVVTEYPCDAPAQIVAGRTYLPFRCLGEACGYTVGWDAATGAVTFR